MPEDFKKPVRRARCSHKSILDLHEQRIQSHENRIEILEKQSAETLAAIISLKSDTQLIVLTFNKFMPVFVKIGYALAILGLVQVFEGGTSSVFKLVLGLP